MVFLDANILLEIILKNRAKRPQVKEYLESLSKSNDFASISMLTANLIMHFGRKEQIDDDLLLDVIDENELLTLSSEDYKWALIHEQRKDFEDALQVSVAIRSGCDTFVTLDSNLAKAYADAPINIVTI
jgi:predicted nucleic acid-binding protein